jgi:hypothetical protein
VLPFKLLETFLRAFNELKDLRLNFFREIGLVLFDCRFVDKEEDLSRRRKTQRP